jgi:CelD/BcsL family acetyltransferase involved in cellulose biosynthesis
VSIQAHVLDPRTDGGWESLVESAPEALVFHHPSWMRLLSDEYGYEIEAWTLRDGERVVAGLPVARVESRLTGRRLVALPFCDVCGPLSAAAADAAARAELLDMIETMRRDIGLPLHVHDQIGGLNSSQPSQTFLHHVVALDQDPAKVEAGFTKSHVKRGARKAQRLGLEVERRTDVDALDSFYRLHVETRRQQGVPVQSRQFIRKFATLFAQGLGHVALVVDDSGVPIAAAVFLTFNGTLTYKFGASHRAALSKRPNNLLFLDTIHWACARGMRNLDLGRTDLDNPGLREFKLSWGATERDLTYTWVSDTLRSGQGGSVPALARAAIRRGPPVVGRMAGRLLYRHIA